MADLVRVWIKDERDAQHLAEAPDDPIAREWEGATACGLAATLRWVPYERVDANWACAACARRHGTYPVLEGGYPGPP